MQRGIAAENCGYAFFHFTIACLFFLWYKICKGGFSYERK